jgi:flavorubredoxin
MITNTDSGTNIQEISDGIYRINTPVQLPSGEQFNFNQYLVDDDSSLLFHTGPRRLFPLVREAIDRVTNVEKLRYVASSHFEADQCAPLNDFLAVAPNSEPVCGRIAAMVSIGDFSDKPPRALADDEELALGAHTVRWFDTPHTPHGWDCGLMMESRTKTFFCGDLFTQGGTGDVALTESDILGPSEAFRKPMDYFAHAPDTQKTLERLACHEPTTLACMHGSAWRGNGAELLRALGQALC